MTNSPNECTKRYLTPSIRIMAYSLSGEPCRRPPPIKQSTLELLNTQTAWMNLNTVMSNEGGSRKCLYRTQFYVTL